LSRLCFAGGSIVEQLSPTARQLIKLIRSGFWTIGDNRSTNSKLLSAKNLRATNLRATDLRATKKGLRLQAL
jgi:hypothetical protein